MATVALSQKVVGSVVKLKFNGAMREFLVVYQGKPSSLYDASCDGTWLLMKDCLEAKRWHSSDVNDYANSEVNSYLNSTVLSKFDKDIQAQIKQVKIPYRPGSGTSGTVNRGTSTTNTVPAGTETVMYRVKAYDGEGLQRVQNQWTDHGNKQQRPRNTRQHYDPQ